MADTSDERSQQKLTIPPGPESTPERVRARAAAAREPAGPPASATGDPARGTGNGRPSDPEEMRLEIERTRERMSYTLDAIEDRIVQQKRELWAKATLQGFRHAVSRDPWRPLAIAFVVGYVVAAIRD
jgi:ElaB/YqjD/DUF883 family membrane-anchored ribosome-binding protein